MTSENPMQFDVLQCVTTLRAHEVVLASEMREIAQDLARLQQLTKKYGAFWDKAMEQLRALRKSKERLAKEVRFQLDLFALHLQTGRELCAKLLKQPMSVQTPEFVVDCDSAILLNATPKPPPGAVSIVRE